MTYLRGDLVSSRPYVRGTIQLCAQEKNVDPEKVALIGWSRSAFWVDAVLVKADYPIAAAVKIDGGNESYTDGGRPWRTDELERIHTPLLIESHGLESGIVHV